MQTPSFYVILSSFFIFLTLLVVSLIFVSFYEFLTKWLRYLQREKERSQETIKAEAYEKATRILEKAKKESLKLISDSNNEAQKILGEAHELSDESKKVLEDGLQSISQRQHQALEKTSNDLLAYYKGIVDQQKQSSLDTLSRVSKDMEEKILEEVDDFGEVLRKETVETQKQVEQKISRKYEDLEKELESYREKQLKKIDERVFELIARVTKLVLGRAISLEEHQSMVLEALEEAKKEGVFDGSKS